MLEGLNWSNLSAKHHAEINYPVSILTVKMKQLVCFIAWTFQLVPLQSFVFGHSIWSKFNYVTAVKQCLFLSYFFYCFMANIDSLSLLSLICCQCLSNSVKKLLTDALNKNQYLRRLEVQQVKDMVECMYERTYQQGEYVIKQGEPGNHLFVLAGMNPLHNWLFY